MVGDDLEYGEEMEVEGEEEEMFEDAHGDDQDENPDEEEVPTQTLSNLTPQHALKVRGMAAGRELIISVDNGATSSFIDATVVQEVECSVMDTTPIKVAVANWESVVSHAKCLNFSRIMNGKPFQADLKILDLGTCDLILGHDWMKEYNSITIDLNEFKISFMKDGKLCELKGIKKRPGQLVPQKPKKLGKGAKGAVLCKLYLVEEEMEEGDAMATDGEVNAMAIAPREQAIPHEVQALLDEFEDVFKEPKTLPPPRKHDHSIPLVPNTTPINFRPYRLVHFQKDEVEKLVDEMLSSGIIQPSHSPFASPILLVKKKDGTW
ncbi:hypothetical protein Dimus_037999 [Dionaea muscipula]